MHIILSFIMDLKGNIPFLTHLYSSSRLYYHTSQIRGLRSMKSSTDVT